MPVVGCMPSASMRSYTAIALSGCPLRLHAVMIVLYVRVSGLVPCARSAYVTQKLIPSRSCSLQAKVTPTAMYQRPMNFITRAYQLGQLASSGARVFKVRSFWKLLFSIGRWHAKSPYHGPSGGCTACWQCTASAHAPYDRPKHAAEPYTVWRPGIMRMSQDVTKYRQCLRHAQSPKPWTLVGAHLRLQRVEHGHRILPNGGLEVHLDQRVEW